MKQAEVDIATSSEYFVLAAQATMACLLLVRSSGFAAQRLSWCWHEVYIFLESVKQAATHIAPGVEYFVPHKLIWPASSWCAFRLVNEAAVVSRRCFTEDVTSWSAPNVLAGQTAEACSCLLLGTFSCLSQPYAKGLQLGSGPAQSTAQWLASWRVECACYLAAAACARRSVRSS